MNNRDFTWTATRRRDLEAKIAETKQNTSLILAAERTHRKDPLDGFNYYHGGWNISETHYYSVSTIKTYLYFSKITNFISTNSRLSFT